MDLKIRAVSPKIGKEIPLPRYATPGSAAMDLHACLDGAVAIPAGGRTVIPTGIAIALPSPDYVALVYARSGLGIKHGIAPANCVGVIDSDYRGEILVGLQNSGNQDFTVQPGDRIAQLMIAPVVRPELQMVDELDETARGAGGFGSTGLQPREPVNADKLCFERGNYTLQFWRPNGVPAYDRAGLEKAAGKRLKFVHFWGHTPERDGHITQTCLSQWWMADFTVDGRSYCCMEQFMMAEKARLFDDQETLEKIMRATVQGAIKALGRQVKDFDQDVWDQCKYTIVLTGNFQKFLQNQELNEFLLRTGDKILVEASPRDRIWGIGMGKTNENADNPAAWRGQNLLGFALMEVRDKLRNR